MVEEPEHQGEDAEDDGWVATLRAAFSAPEQPRTPMRQRGVDEFGRDLARVELSLAPEPDSPAPAPSTRTEPEPASAAPPPVVPPELVELQGQVQEVRDVLAELVRQVATPAATPPVQPVAPRTSEALETSIVEAVNRAMLRAQATGDGTDRLEAEVRVLAESVRRLSKQVEELDTTALARDRREQDLQVDRLAEASERASAAIEEATRRQATFEANIEAFLGRGVDGQGEGVAWTDVLLLAHELRSRVDDLHQQQRVMVADLQDWQLRMEDQQSAILRLRD